MLVYQRVFLTKIITILSAISTSGARLRSPPAAFAILVASWNAGPF